METFQHPDKRSFSRNWQITIKSVVIGGLMLMLFIPRFMILELVRERESTSRAARQEITEKWSRAQTVRGPLLVVPYTVDQVDSKGVTYQELHYCHFLPKRLTADGEISTRNLYRSIYETVVYESELAMEGRFEKPDFGRLKVNPERVLWDKAELLLSISDLRGIHSAVSLVWNGKSYPFSPGTSIKSIGADGISIDFSDPSLQTFPADFHIDLSLKGSDGLYFAPFGETTAVSLRSAWSDPGFTGNYLPAERDITPEGFTARWQVLHFNRNFPQEWVDGNFNATQADFGVELVNIAGHYQKSERSAKYSILVILLIFLSFFLYEIITRQRIHPFQYVLVGSAILIFYVLLLSVSEHLGFNPAYLIASLLITGMVLAYSRTFLKTWSHFLLLASVLVLCFGFIFILLQLESYSLLAGSIGLFVVLGAIMFLTRKINWYEN